MMRKSGVGIVLATNAEGADAELVRRQGEPSGITWQGKHTLLWALARG